MNRFPSIAIVILALSALPASVGVAVLGLFLALALRASRTGDGASLASRALRATAGASAKLILNPGT